MSRNVDHTERDRCLHFRRIVIDMTVRIRAHPVGRWAVARLARRTLASGSALLMLVAWHFRHMERRPADRPPDGLSRRPLLLVLYYPPGG